MEATDLKATKILVIDDDEDILRIVSRFLGSHGYRCATAGTGAQGISEFTEGDVDLIITDLNMPVGNGVQLIQAVRQHSAVPIIIVTAFEKEYANQVRFLPHVTVMNKPFDSQALLDLVGIMLAPGHAA